MEVPLISEYSPAGHALSTSCPGANTSRHEPKLEKLERTSDCVEAPTVMAVDSLAGLNPHAFLFEFPAATTVAIPSETRALTP
jgi:hypothetical protein